MRTRRFTCLVICVGISAICLSLLTTFLKAQAVGAKLPSSIPSIEAVDFNPVLPASPVQDPVGIFTVSPDPPIVGEPTEIRVTQFNNNDTGAILYAEFFVSPLGIGQVLQPIALRILFSLPPHGEGSTSVYYVPQSEGPFCFYVYVFDSPSATDPIAVYQNNTVYRGHPDPSLPSYAEAVPIPVRNPLHVPASIELSISVPTNAAGWVARPDPPHLFLNPGQSVTAHAIFTYTGSGQLPLGGSVVFGFNATANGQPAGRVDILYGPPLRLHTRPDPPFAETEISVTPYPIPAGEPAEICVEVRNVTDQPHDALVYFREAPFGIGMVSDLMAPPQQVRVPGRGKMRPCIQWVAPQSGQFSFEAQVETPGFPMLVSSLRVVDVSELLLPNTTSPLHFPVRNPMNQPVTVTLVLNPLQPWQMVIDTPVLVNMHPQETRLVTLAVTVPPGATMPPDGTPVADVEAFAGTDPLQWLSIGGFRKIYRPPVPIHQPRDPVYAESEIKVNPYPPREREPTEICVDVNNPTIITQSVTVDFNVANFGIGLPFHMIARPIPLTLPAQSIKTVCVTWVPPFGGPFGVEIGLQSPGHERVYSQRVIDVGEILLPNQPSPFGFMVGNPYTSPITVTLAAILHLPQWEVTFHPPVLNLPAEGVSPVEMVVTPVQRAGDPEPVQGQPVIDVEAYWEGNGNPPELLGGFRKLFFPPVPVHRPEEQPFAESEINIAPYPPLAGEPTRLSFEARNPTTATQQVSITFEVGNFGIGLGFVPIDRIHLNLPPGQAGIVGATWVPPFAGEFCVRVKVDAPGFAEPFYSARNISIVRLPQPYGLPEAFVFLVGDGGTTTRPLTVSLGLRDYLPGWHVALKKNQILLAPGELIATDVLTITPPANPADLPIDGSPIADVSAYVNGDLIGGIRKVWRPPVPLGQLGETGYAESEIVINPDPPLAGHPTTFAAQVRNNSDHAQNISVQFGWADFGFGIPFANTNVVPTQTLVHLAPYQVATVSAQWTPTFSGHYCIQIRLTNPETHEHLLSQHNVEVIRIPETDCEPIRKEFLLQNSTSLPVTVTIGSSAINLPAGWDYTVHPTMAVLEPYQSITVTLVITPPCSLMAQPGVPGALDPANPAKVQVEGYDQAGALVGGIQVELVAGLPYTIKLPIVMRNK